MAKDMEQISEFQRLKVAIKEKKFQRLYFFFGEETFLLHHYLEQMKRSLTDELTESFNFHKLTQENFDVDSFADAVENLPMMAETTFVVADEIDIYKLSESDRNKLIQVFADIPDYCTVVFTYEAIAWNPDSRMQEFHAAVKKYGTQVSFDRQGQRELIAWVGRHFAAEKKRISPDLCNYLIDLTGGSMTLMAGEIRKICAYSGAEQIVKSDIDAVTEPVLDAVVYQMTDLLGAGEYGAALLKLRQLLTMQSKPLLILGTIGSHFRRLSAAKTLLDNGEPYTELMRLYNIKEYPAKKLSNSAGRFSVEFCRLAVELVMQTDYQMKTSWDDPERLLEMLILRLAQEAQRG